MIFLRSIARRIAIAARARPILLALAVAGIGGALVFATFPHLLAYRTVATFRANAIRYNSTSLEMPWRRIERSDATSPRTWTDPTTGLPRDLRVREIDVGFSFRPSSRAPKRDGYYDLFGTAPSNAGLRLEYTSDGKLSIVVGAHTPAGYAGYVLATSVRPNVRHTFHMTIDRFGNLAADYDGTNHLGVAAPELVFQISDVTLGSGFSPRRKFFGTIDDAAISYGIYDRNPFGDAEAVDLEAVCVLLALTSLYFFIGVEGRSALRWSWRGRAPWTGTSRQFRVDSQPFPDLARDSQGRSLSYTWPLPDDVEVSLILETPELTQRALTALARDLRTLRTAAARTTYALNLPNDTTAMLRFGGVLPPTDRALAKFVDYLHDLAAFAGA